MQLGIINSAFSQVGVDFATGIRHIREIGFDTVDIQTEAWGVCAAEKEMIVRECRANGLPIVSLTCCALGIADFAGPVRRFHLDRVKAFLDLTAAVGGRNLLLVLGEYIWQKEVIPPAAQWGWAVEAVREAGEYAKKLGLEIVIELEPFHMSIVNTVDLMAAFIREVAHPAVFANIDVSHVVLSGAKPEELRKFKGLAHHVHFSDCDGKVHGDLPPGQGVIDFKPWMRELAALDMPGVLSIELEFCPQPERIVDWVREAYRETARLMAEAGLRPLK
ncbi:sugar phosphate isomerase/epimerase [bacterium]|nr:sugar phosphate isomerase/epimerase [bacterium]